jgi:YjbE family integral membrane protein
VTFDAAFLTSVLSIVVIDITLAGDNAVVIAMAARTLPKAKRRKTIFLGALAAVLVRVILTFFVAQLLGVQFVKLVGGLVILWVAVKLFTAEGSSKHEAGREAHNMWEAIKIIVIADISMGVDNMLAVGGASGGSLALLLFGLGLSIPFVVFASDFLSRLMDRWPVILYLGAAILGRVAGNMIMTDPTTVSMLAPSQAAVYAVEALLAVGIVAVGYAWRRRVARLQRAQPVAMERDVA